MAGSVKQFLTNKRISMLEYPLNLPDLAPCDSQLTPKVNRALKRTNLQFVEEVKAKTAKLLKRVTIDELQRYLDNGSDRSSCI